MNTCWQHLRKKEIEKTHPVSLSNSSLQNYEITEIDYNMAKEFILRYEWLGNMGTSKYCYGMLFSGQLASVVCYGAPVAPSKYAKILGFNNFNSIIQLCRGATAYWAPKYVPSKLISYTIKLINKKLGVRAVIAYADPLAGEIGTIYQACNAFYIGMTSPGGGKRYIINGHSYDPRKVHKKFGSRAQNHLSVIDPNYKVQTINSKHRYLFILGTNYERELVFNRIKDIILEYPKRD